MAKTIEDVLAAGEAFVAWDGQPDDGTLTLSAFALSGGGARQAAFKDVPVGQVDAVSADMRRRGVSVGGYDFHCDHAWLGEADRFRVWGKDALVLDAGEREVMAGDRRWARGELEGVAAFVDEDMVRRGVAVVVTGGERVPVVLERSAGAMSMPTYDRYDAMMDTAWTVRLAKELSSFLGVPVVAG